MQLFIFICLEFINQYNNRFDLNSRISNYQMQKLCLEGQPAGAPRFQILGILYFWFSHKIESYYAIIDRFKDKTSK